MKKNLIDKVVKYYRYNESIDYDNIEDFLIAYQTFTDKKTLKNNPEIIWGVLKCVPNSTHIAAKNKLFKNDNECWMFFERTALFLVKSLINDPWIDHSKAILEYCLYMERFDLIKEVFAKIKGFIEKNIYNPEYISQKIYPSTCLVYFLIEQYLDINPLKNSILDSKNNFGIYDELINNWNNISNIKPQYWNELCDYHLERLGMSNSEKRETEEFLFSGLVPMELINIIKTRKKNKLDIPNFCHELFKCPMAQEPLIPSGYNDELDIKYQVVKQTIETQKKIIYEDVKYQIENKYGSDTNILS